jgi:excisionase family DNA binding protein
MVASYPTNNPVMLVTLTTVELQALIHNTVESIFDAKMKAPIDEYPDLPEFMTRQQVAELMNISLMTLDTWVRQGKLPKYKTGSVVRFKKKEVIAATKKCQKFSRE